MAVTTTLTFLSHTTADTSAAASTMPAGMPSWITAELVQLTIKVWQPFYRVQLTIEEAVQIILNAGRLFGVLGVDRGRRRVDDPGEHHHAKTIRSTGPSLIT